LITIKGEKFFKPFVEKPIDAENHGICIYYSMEDGGGCKTLFRCNSIFKYNSKTEK